jgi:hypothetical protein
METINSENPCKILTYIYDYGYGSSKFIERPLVYNALYNLVVIAQYTDLSRHIPILISEFGKEKKLNHHICWVLNSFAKINTKNAKFVLEQIENLSENAKLEIFSDSEGKNLKKRPKKTSKKRRKTN